MNWAILILGVVGIGVLFSLIKLIMKGAEDLNKKKK